MTARTRPGRADLAWLRTLRAYLAVLVALMLAWEVAQLPLYTLWRERTAGEIAWAVIHCTAGDAIIGMSSLGAALLLAGAPEWPRARFGPVLLLTLGIGLAVTVYLEWLNVEVKRAWAYAEAMPRLPPFGTGLTPFLQWVLLPPAALLVARWRGGGA
ncbi:hypothetical protein DFH01_25440 [Falsiroseomonas bella]|uniref:Uncharacterized protein n=1 Tax=Falsiroseomonas bella TaxID=2184016 RepID=A0A317F9W6_9PROT|nr:hypothetical protein [Falsiroseomonas bella]PWS34366.1 hypothetical protein DFH01_25440 [Falsiroseomonas bella]